jgi:hypothetical protein
MITSLGQLQRNASAMYPVLLLVTAALSNTAELAAFTDAIAPVV